MTQAGGGDTKVSQTHLHETSRTRKPTERWEDRGGGGGRGVGDLFFRDKRH